MPPTPRRQRAHINNPRFPTLAAFCRRDGRTAALTRERGGEPQRELDPSAKKRSAAADGAPAACALLARTPAALGLPLAAIAASRRGTRFCLRAPAEPALFGRSDP